jgi:crotonobetainyl-CoA:carnitine CoA-transferase CaiB-like acyl-CoA transferase
MPGPLTGYRVLELGNLIAAPYAGRIFAEFGAEVIKVERPRGGDELRKWRLPRGDTSMFFLLQGRNKKSVTLDLRTPEGQQLARDLVGRSDVVLENFRPGTLEGWGLDYDALRAVNPGVILVRISGYGQTGPYRDRPGFANVAEALGGLRHLTGYPDRPPVRAGISLGDSLAGLFGVVGALLALLHRERSGATPGGGAGQVVDVALYEAVFAMLESTVPEYDAYGTIRQRTGNTLPGIAPSNIYPCREEKWIVIGANADALFKRLMVAIGRPDLADDPRFADNPSRSREADFLDGVIGAWTARHTLDEAMAVLNAAGVPAGPIYAADDIVADPHFQSRAMFEAHEVAITPDDRRTVRFPAIVPKLSATPGEAHSLGPALGEHNAEVYGELLGLDASRIAALREAGVI